MTEPHVCGYRKVRPCSHAHVRSLDPKRMGPTVPSVCMCCGTTLLYWDPWGGR